MDEKAKDASRPSSVVRMASAFYAGECSTRSGVFFPTRGRALSLADIGSSNAFYYSEHAIDTAPGPSIPAAGAAEGDGFWTNAVLSISTYGEMICGSKDEAIIGKVNNVIMPFLINRIRVEIALYYMKYVLKSDLARSKKWGAGGKPVAVG